MNLRIYLEKIKNIQPEWKLLSMMVIAISIPVSLMVIQTRQDNRQKAQKAITLPTTATALQITDELIKETAEYSSSSFSKRENLKAEIEEIAKEREEAVEKLIEEDPEEFLKTSVSEKIKDALPENAKTYIESAIEIEGRLRIIQIDNLDKTSKTDYFLNTDEKQYTLHPTEELLDLKSGTNIDVVGKVLGNKIAVDANDSNSISASDDVLAATSNGEQRVAVILVNFTDNTAQPLTKDYVNNFVFNISDGWFKEVSYNKTFLSGNVFGWYTIPMSLNSAGCDYIQLATLAKQAANNDITFANYDRFLYIFQDSSFRCNWAGLSDIGSFNLPTPQGTIIASESLVKSNSFTLGLVTHELGHALGLYHANGLECGSSSHTESGCSTQEYANEFDVMGISGSGHYSAYNKEYLGWLPSSNIQTISSNSTFTIAPIETPSTSIQAVKIPVRQNGNGSALDYYYLEYKQPLGFDSNLIANAFTGLMINWAPVNFNTGFGRTHLVDSTPGSGGGLDFIDAPLQTGSTYSNNPYGISLTPISQNPSGITVNFTKGQSQCVKNNPSIVVTPVSQQGITGQTLSYSAQITNNNVNCPNESYTITNSLFSGFIFQVNPSQINLASGAIANTTIQVTSDQSLSNGIYTFHTDVYNSSQTQLLSSTFNSYVVFNPNPSVTPNPTSTPTHTPTPTRTPTPTNTPTPTPTPTDIPGKTGDINGDNAVGILDLSILLSNWNLTNPTNPRADINKDGTVGILDLSILLSNWGT